MNQPIKVGMVGDYNPSLHYHDATEESMQHAAAALSISLAFEWIPTRSLEETPARPELRQFDAIWSAPGDYQSKKGVFKAIRFAREQGWPFIGT